MNNHVFFPRSLQKITNYSFNGRLLNQRCKYWLMPRPAFALISSVAYFHSSDSRPKSVWGLKAVQVKAPWTSCLSSWCLVYWSVKSRLYLTFRCALAYVCMLFFFFSAEKHVNKNFSLDPLPFQLLSWSEFSWHKHHQLISFLVCLFLAAWSLMLLREGLSRSAWASLVGACGL